jgi:hypothetical protein
MTNTNMAETPPNINITRLSAPANDGGGECSSVTLMLAKADLARSGLTLEDAQANGMHFIDDASAVHPDFARHPAIIIPYWRMDGSRVTYDANGVGVPYVRPRYLSGGMTPLPKDGRKYDAPRGSGSQIYVPQLLASSVLPEGALVCVEGEKKAAALCKFGINCVAIGGVDNVRESKSASHALHPDLAAVVSQFTDVCIIFDSDIATNPNVERAEQRLATLLALLGVRVRCVRIPPSDKIDAKGKPFKVGADDFLVAHGADALRDLILSTPALGERQQSQPSGAIAAFDMLGRDVRPVEELIPGLLEKGIITFLCAPGGNHKSRLAQQWAQALNVGACPFGRQYGEEMAKRGAPAPARATMIHVSAEDDENELARRAQGIADVLELPPPAKPAPDDLHAGGVFLAQKGKDTALAIMGENGDCTLRPFYYELLALLRNIPGHKVVVLDSAYDFVRFKGYGKIDEDSVNLFIKVVLQGICDKGDCTIIMPWHPSQAGSGRNEMDGWSVAWRNAARARLVIEASDKEDEFVLRVEKRNHGRKGDPIKLRFYQGALLPTELVPHAAEDAGALRGAVVREAIRAAELGVPFTSQRNIDAPVIQLVEKELARKITSKAFKDELRAALDVGQLRYMRGDKRTRAGYYPSDETMAKELARRAKQNGEATQVGRPS